MSFRVKFVLGGNAARGQGEGGAVVSHGDVSDVVYILRHTLCAETISTRQNSSLFGSSNEQMLSRLAQQCAGILHPMSQRVIIGVV